MANRRDFSLYHEIPADAKVENLMGEQRPTHVKIFVYFSSAGIYKLSFANVHRKLEHGMICESQDLDVSGKNDIHLDKAPRFNAKKLEKIRHNLACKIDSIGMMWLDAGLNDSLKQLLNAWANQ